MGGHLVGREREQRRLLELVSAARSGTGAAVLLHGDPGIGKSSTLDWLAEQSRECTVLRARGHEADAGRSYLVVRELVRPLSDLLPQLDEPLFLALGAVMAASGDLAHQPLVGLAVLELFSQASSISPLLLLLDDAHSFDESSLEVLSFVSRRLLAESMLVVVGARTQELVGRTSFEGLEQLHLAGLDRLASQRVVENEGLEFRPEMYTSTGGNPLALRHLGAVKYSGGAVPMPARLRSGFRLVIDRLPLETQQALALVAIAGGAPTDVIQRALEGLGRSSTDLLAAREAGLIDEAGDFSHPLMRAAALPTESLSFACHDALAHAYATVSEVDAVLHRLLGSGPLNADVLAAAVHHAHQFAAIGHIDESIALLVAAAPHEVDGRSRSSLLREAALTAAYSGRYERSLELFRQSLDASTDVQDRCRVLRTMVWCELFCGATAPDSARRLRRAIDELTLRDGDVSERALAWGSLIGLWTLHDCFRAMSAVHEAPDDPYLHADVLFAQLLANDGRAVHGLADLKARIGVPKPFERVEEDISSTVYAESLLLAGDWAAADDWNERYLDNARRQRVSTELGPVTARCIVSRAMLGDATTAHGLALTAIERFPSTTQVLSAAALIGGMVGAIEAGSWATECCAIGQRLETTGAAIEGRARLVMIDLSADDPVAALPHAQRAWELLVRHGFRHPGFGLARGDVGEAFARNAMAVEARLVATELMVGHHVSDWSRGVGARVLGLLGDLDQFDHSLRLVASSPWEAGRTLLSWARALAESNPVRSVELARAALDRFELMGARPWAALAGALVEPGWVDSGQQELVALLSQREFAVALTIARGLTNKEIARELFISQKTVDAHLQRIFRKLDVRSRTQLAAMMYEHRVRATPLPMTT